MRKLVNLFAFCSVFLHFKPLFVFYTELNDSCCSIILLSQDWFQGQNLHLYGRFLLFKKKLPFLKDYSIIIQFSPSLSSFQSLPYICPFPFPNSWIVVTLMYIHTYIHRDIYSQMQKYNLLSLYTLTYMYVWRTDNLILDNICNVSWASDTEAVGAALSI